tara:strand:+ start:330 stop:590 length:261 start_codon:yes stop_codon:yes gene_type:complete
MNFTPLLTPAFTPYSISDDPKDNRNRPFFIKELLRKLLRLYNTYLIYKLSYLLLTILYTNWLNSLRDRSSYNEHLTVFLTLNGVEK